MSIGGQDNYLTGLVHELRKLPGENEWVEFKVNVYEPEEIGEYVSALANSAAMVGKAAAYLVWGISDGAHEIVGTNFKPSSEKVGNEELENWLLRHLEPRIQFHFSEVAIDDHLVVLLDIERAHHRPVQFRGQEFIRVGSYKKKLKDFSRKRARFVAHFRSCFFRGWQCG